MSEPSFRQAANVVREFAAGHEERWGSAPYHPGLCPACGQDTLFFCTDLASAHSQMTCAECATVSRDRALALGFLDALDQLTRLQSPSVAALAGVPFRRRLLVQDRRPVGTDPLRDILRRIAWVGLESDEPAPTAHDAAPPTAEVAGEVLLVGDLDLRQGDPGTLTRFRDELGTGSLMVFTAPRDDASAEALSLDDLGLTVTGGRATDDLLSGVVGSRFVICKRA